MSPAVLVAGASAVVLLWIVARRLFAARRAGSAAETADHLLDRVTRYDLQPQPGGTAWPAQDAGHELIVVRDLAAAEDLLDRLDAAGCDGREMVVLADSTVLLRRRPRTRTVRPGSADGRGYPA
jgi:hypothetical protein